jgi:hypothetical protein
MPTKSLGVKAEATVRAKYDKNSILEKNLAFYSSLLT